jgi:hypothetical protein
VIAAGCALATLALIICAAYAWRVLPGHARPGCLRRTTGVRVTSAVLTVLIAVLRVTGAVRAAVVRARWAWRCHGRPPVPRRGEEKLTGEEIQALGNLAAGRDVRSRT